MTFTLKADIVGWSNLAQALRRIADAIDRDYQGPVFPLYEHALGNGSQPYSQAVIGRWTTDKK